MTTKEFKLYVYKWAKEIGVASKISSIHLRKMKNKIASCSSKGRLTFDLSILEEKKEKINKVIVHELLHYRYPNHSKIFKYTLESIIRNKEDVLNF